MAPEEVAAKCRGLGLAIRNISMRNTSKEARTADGLDCRFQCKRHWHRYRTPAGPIYDNAPVPDPPPGEGRVRYTLSRTCTVLYSTVQ